MKKDKRIINIRVPFVAFCGLMAGILFSMLFLMKKISVTTGVLIAVAILILAVAIFVYAKVSQKQNENYKFRKNVSVILKISALSFLISFFVGIAILIKPFVTIYTYQRFNNVVTVGGIVCDYIKEDSTYKKFLINKIYIVDGDEYYSPDCKICVYSNKQTSVSLGDQIVFSGMLETNDIRKDSDKNKLFQAIGYRTFVSSSDIVRSDGTANLRELIHDKTLEILEKNLNHDNAQISFAILFGQKQGLSDEIKDMFSFAGISHILAVSGLHIGVLVSIMYFCLKKFNINKYIRILVLSSILLFYSYLCSFSPGVCRASIMAIILCLCDVFKWEYDILSSLSIAGIIILLFNPLSLFTVSFQLSFLCIFAIITLYPSLEKLLCKCRLPKFLSSSIALSVSVNIAILPICFNVFVNVSLLGIITNIFVLPIFSLTYVLLFVIWVFSIIFNYLGFLLFFPNLFLQIIKTIANFAGTLDIGVYKVFSISYWSLVFLIVFALIIQFLMLKRVIKASLAFVLAGIILSLFIFGITPVFYKGENLILHFKFAKNSCYYVDNNMVTMIGADIDETYVLNELKKSKISSINNIIAYDFQLNDINNLKKICKDNNVKTLYLPKKFEFDEIIEQFDCVKFFGESLVIGKMMFTAYSYNDAIVAINLHSEKMGNVLIPEVKPNKAESNYIHSVFATGPTLDYIYLDKTDTNLDLDYLKPNKVIANVSSDADICLYNGDIKVLNFG